MHMDAQSHVEFWQCVIVVLLEVIYFFLISNILIYIPEPDKQFIVFSTHGRVEKHHILQSISLLLFLS